jgi:hypothetical protein
LVSTQIYLLLYLLSFYPALHLITNCSILAGLAGGR